MLQSPPPASERPHRARAWSVHDFRSFQRATDPERLRAFLDEHERWRGQFRRTGTEMTVAGMPGFFERVIDEKLDVDNKPGRRKKK